MEKQTKVMIQLGNDSFLLDPDMVKLYIKRYELVQDSVGNPFRQLDNAKKIISLNKRIRKNVICLKVYTEEQKALVFEKYNVVKGF